MGLEPTTLYTPDRALYQLSYRGSSAGWAQISHLIVHLMNMLTINSVCYFALFVCLTLLASFFLPSHLSLKTCIYMYVWIVFQNTCHAHLTQTVLHVSSSQLAAQLHSHGLAWLTQQGDFESHQRAPVEHLWLLSYLLQVVLRGQS